MGQPHGIGIIGLGVISGAYLQTLAGRSDVRITAVADLDADRAHTVASGIPGARALTVAELLAEPAVDTVLNLTIPAAHAEIALAAVQAGKDVYGEKPLTATLDEAQAVTRAATEHGRRIGCAPDTVLGTGVQTARAMIDAGEIGRPVSAIATMLSPGHESWHPHPDFYYLPGGGPLLDMGPYYLTALVQLLGPVARVVGASSRTRDVRTIATGPRQGVDIPVEVDTHVTALLTHEGGAISTIVMSFDAVATEANPIEIHGENGSLVVPDPNQFAGYVRIRRRGAPGFEIVPPRAGYQEAARGVGLLDFVAGAPGPGRASGDLALHVLEVMTAVLRAADGNRVEVASTVDRPAPVPLTSSW